MTRSSLLALLGFVALTSIAGGAVIGGFHAAGFILLIRHHRQAPLAAAAAGFSILIWIFVQTVFIPFSVLQAVYFAAGLAELGFLLLLLGLLAPAGRQEPVKKTRTP